MLFAGNRCGSERAFLKQHRTLTGHEFQLAIELLYRLKMKMSLLAFVLIFLAGESRNETMDAISIQQLVQATAAKEITSPLRGRTFCRVRLDSRAVQNGDLFWAVQGERHDGHAFVDQAVANGALACVVDKNPGGLHSTKSVVVDNTVAALADFAAWYRSHLDAIVIGITGSFGKTTTREVVYSVLREAHQGIRSSGNFNNHFGVPLTILELGTDHEFGVVELGASARGEIHQLCRIAAPEIGIITGIGLSHMTGFGTLRGIIDSKSELLESLPQTGIAVLTGDNSHVREMQKRAACQTILVGCDSCNDIIAEEVVFENRRIAFRVDETRYEMLVSGRHHLNAALAAIAIAREIGMGPADIQTGLRSFRPVDRRSQPLEIGPWTVIDDTYNANPASMQAACQLLADWQTNAKKILVTGDMLELSSDAEKQHYDLGFQAATAKFDYLLAMGDYAEQVALGAGDAGMPSSRLCCCRDLPVLTAVLDCWLEDSDVILVKGSRGMKMERVIEWIKNTSIERYEEHTFRQEWRNCA